MAKPRKKLFLYCGDDATESCMRFTLETRLHAHVYLIIDNANQFANAGQVFDAAVIWQTGIGETLSTSLKAQGMKVVDVVPDVDEIGAIVERAKTALRGVRGPKRQALEVAA